MQGRRSRPDNKVEEGPRLGDMFQLLNSDFCRPPSLVVVASPDYLGRF